MVFLFLFVSTHHELHNNSNLHWICDYDYDVRLRFRCCSYKFNEIRQPMCHFADAIHIISFYLTLTHSLTYVCAINY